MSRLSPALTSLAIRVSAHVGLLRQALKHSEIAAVAGQSATEQVAPRMPSSGGILRASAGWPYQGSSQPLAGGRHTRVSAGVTFSMDIPSGSVSRGGSSGCNQSFLATRGSGNLPTIESSPRASLVRGGHVSACAHVSCSLCLTGPNPPPCRCSPATAPAARPCTALKVGAGGRGGRSREAAGSPLPLSPCSSNRVTAAAGVADLVRASAMLSHADLEMANRRRSRVYSRMDGGAPLPGGHVGARSHQSPLPLDGVMRTTSTPKVMSRLGSKADLRAYHSEPLPSLDKQQQQEEQEQQGAKRSGQRGLLSCCFGGRVEVEGQ